MPYKPKGFANINYGSKGSVGRLSRVQVPLNELEITMKSTLDDLYGSTRVAMSLTLPLGLITRLMQAQPATQGNRSEFTAYCVHQGLTRLIEKEIAEESVNESGDDSP